MAVSWHPPAPYRSLARLYRGMGRPYRSAHTRAPASCRGHSAQLPSPLVTIHSSVLRYNTQPFKQQQSQYNKCIATQLCSPAPFLATIHWVYCYTNFPHSLAASVTIHLVYCDTIPPATNKPITIHFPNLPSHCIAIQLNPISLCCNTISCNTMPSLLKPFQFAIR